MTREELLAKSRQAYHTHPDTSVRGEDELLRYLLDVLDQAYDPSDPKRAARTALFEVVTGALVMLAAVGMDA